ncbi:RNA polymerase sigma factor [Clostridia bacterium]|nr:RNA polymerase sigma factor [Clostridia bacterium]
MREISEIEDFEVINLVLNQNPDYFEELVRRYKNLVYSVILKLHNDREEVNDLAQDVFIKVYKNLHRYYPDYKFSTWIMRIATNHVIDYKRKKKYDTTPIDDVSYELAEDSEKSPECAFIEKERRGAINALLAGLPDMYKIPVLLYHQEGLSYQEISETIGEPLSKVKNRIFRARRMLKEQIEGREGDLYG